MFVGRPQGTKKHGGVHAVDGSEIIPIATSLELGDGTYDSQFLRCAESTNSMRPKPSALDLEVFERQAGICRAFAHPKRLQLLDILGRGEEQVSSLQKALGISKANLSQHLAILKAAGVVSARRNGRAVYCALTLPEVKTACHLIRQVLRGQIRKQRKFEA
jgi:DNA-binding transcriptional ArsR family regulator